MKLIDDTYLVPYQKEVGQKIDDWFEAYVAAPEKPEVSYITKASAVYSANIEGNSVDLNSFMNSIIAKEKFKPQKEIQEIADLIKAYEFAQDNALTEKNFLKAHTLLSQTILLKGKRGVYRNDRMGVFDSTGLVYLAIEPEWVAEKIKELFEDIAYLLKQDLTITAAFYYASFIHLKLAHIHPFWDGNGRMARLVEKWFLAAKINSRAWKLQSEKYYKENLQAYYQHINLGVNYYELTYDKSMPFLKMLAKSLLGG